MEYRQTGKLTRASGFGVFIESPLCKHDQSFDCPHDWSWSLSRLPPHDPKPTPYVTVSVFLAWPAPHLKTTWEWPAPHPKSLVRLFNRTQGTQAMTLQQAQHYKSPEITSQKQGKGQTFSLGQAKFFTSQTCWERSMPRIERCRKWRQLANAYGYTCMCQHGLFESNFESSFGFVVILSSGQIEWIGKCGKS